MKYKIEELKKQKFGRLTIQKEDLPRRDKGNRPSRRVVCICDCGNAKSYDLASLIKKNTQSCGCLHREISKEIIKPYYTHHKSYTRIYRIWIGMRSRCKNPNDNRYPDYGARGIGICEEWDNNFMSFYKWSMDNKYNNKLVIDRINTYGNYEPSNCRWTTSKENNRNSRMNKISMIDAINIRNAYLLGCFKQKEIAKGYNVSNSTINQIIKNKTWI